MMKIFVINLEASVHRRKMMEEQLCRLGLEYEIVTATNGHCLTGEELAVVCDQEAVAREPEWLSPGAIGCALSHGEAQRRIVEQLLPVAVVLEDDLLLPDDFGDLLAGIEAVTGRNGLTLLYWLSNEVHPFRHQTKIGLGGERTMAISAEPERLLSSVGYVLTSSVAARLVELNRPVRVTADSWGYFYANRAVAEIGCLIPSPITLANLPSDIRYGRQSGLRLVKRWMEENLPFVQRLSAWRRDRYFRTRTRYHWI
jgi:glycosyl transferase family 25